MSGYDELRSRLEKDMSKHKTNQGNPNFQFRPAQDNHPKQQEQKKDDAAEVDMEVILKRASLFFGIFVAAISIYFSYDGFDNSVTGGNSSYSFWAKIIGLILAMAVTLLQFVFSSAYKNLNATLKFFGILSYAYSMWTNYQGITHTLQMEHTMAIAATLFMDGIPEPLIAWALGASQKGDFIGNVMKTFGHLIGIAVPEKKQEQNKRQYQYDGENELYRRLGK